MGNRTEPFFKPWVGKNYADGFEGARTMVLGAYHICSDQCEHKSKCCSRKEIRDMDCECPSYKSFEDQKYYRLSNSNEIEIDSFIDKEAHYPAYQAFTCYMFGLRDQCPSEKRSELWESVLFTNMLQHWVPDAEVELTADDFDEDFDALWQVISEYKPQVIYAWNAKVKECLKRHPEQLICLGNANMAFSLNVSVFLPIGHDLSDGEIKNLKARRGIVGEQWVLEDYRNAVKRHLDHALPAKPKLRFSYVALMASILREMVGKGYLETCESGSLRFVPKRWSKELKCYFKQALQSNFNLDSESAGIAALLGDPRLGSYAYPKGYEPKPAHLPLQQYLDSIWKRSNKLWHH